MSMQMNPVTSRSAPKRFLMKDLEVAMDENAGFCVACGAWADAVEPDAERYRCETCGQMQVFGAEQLVLLGYVEKEEA